MKNIKNLKEINEEIQFDKKKCTYCSGIQCPYCYSHYLRSANKEETFKFIKINKIHNQKVNIAVCEDCDEAFNEIDGLYQYSYEEEDYYEKNENHYYNNLISEIYNS
ncbi:hypothetical protein OAY11_01190 [Pelagibacteraceae bacterium]|nr:hypothetical protein [Pelagibacteraceae bacterium]